MHKRVAALPPQGMAFVRTNLRHFDTLQVDGVELDVPHGVDFIVTAANIGGGFHCESSSYAKNASKLIDAVRYVFWRHGNE